eukprot:TRINITY_DN77848_c0_g1_i1.p1 TRINITY_DN77848_c0_g1~~TRINITY_DN77848_c0_g1_i1.p1  ORF type:complete len:123 (-),score=14.81 TRINITY_DN77848_c0_g1_i1:17-343(-)
MPVVPKKRVTQYLCRRRHLLFYLDHYRFLFKHRREHFDRKRYQESMYVQDYTTPNFRFPGFWPGKFGYHPSQDTLQLGNSEDLGPQRTAITDGLETGRGSRLLSRNSE